MDDSVFLIPLTVIPLTALLAFSLSRILTYGKWHKRHRHKCGYHKMTIGRVRDTELCPGCGEKAPLWEHYVARARWPLGWEEMPND